VVAPPNSSDAYVIDGAPSNLATAGSGDVLAGICAGLLARSREWPVAKTVAHAARLHAMAGARGHRVGLLSSDLPRLVAEILSEEVTHGR
jgi:NAD(P)H-hydrate repair Nnr-like enzyme with NAD(P)H-hydrate dehydratase domain